MKRDWKLIRAILNCEPLDGFDSKVVCGHLRLLGVRGWVDGRMAGDSGGFYNITPAGYDAGAKLAGKNRLDRVLDHLAERDIGPSEQIVFGLIEQLERREAVGLARA